MRLTLTDDAGHLLVFHRTATTASFFDHCVKLLRGRLVGTAPDGQPIDVGRITSASVQMTYTELGILRAQDVLPWIPKNLLSGIRRSRLAWIVLDDERPNVPRGN